MQNRQILNLPSAANSLRLVVLIASIPILFVAPASAQQFTPTHSALWQNASGHNLAVHPHTGEILVAARDSQETAIVRTYSPDLSKSTECGFGKSDGIGVAISPSGKFINVTTMPSGVSDFTCYLFNEKLSTDNPLAKREIHAPELPVNGLSLGDHDAAPTIMILNLETKTVATENLLTRHQISTTLTDDLQLLRFPILQAISPNFSLFAVGRTGPTWTDPGFDLYHLPALTKIDIETEPIKNVSTINFAQHSQTLLVGDEAGQIAVWDLQKPKPRRTCLIQPSRLLAKHTVRQLALSKNGRYLAGKLDNDLAVWKTSDGEYLTTLDRQNRDWTSFAWRNNTLITLADEYEKTQSKKTHIELWDIRDDKKTSVNDSSTRSRLRSTSSPAMQKYTFLLVSVLMILNGVLYFIWPAFRNLGMKDPRVIEGYADLERQFGFKIQLLNPWFVRLFTAMGIVFFIAALLFWDSPSPGN